MTYPRLPHEAERVAVLRRMKILDTASTPALDRLVAIAGQIFAVPRVMVTLVDEDRLWHKAAIGYDGLESPRDTSFCTYTILHDAVFVTPDAAADSRFSDGPYVNGDVRIRFYAGAPLVVQAGIRIGALCVLDTKPRDLDDRQLRILTGLARMVTDELWLEHLDHGSFVDLEVLDHPAGDTRELDVSRPITGFQVRAGRGLVNWSVRELAAASGVSTTTIKRLEGPTPERPVRDPIGRLLRQALEEVGVTFVFRPGGVAGVEPAHGVRPADGSGALTN